MKKRENLVEKFSTFLNFINCNDSSIAVWETNPKLVTNMKQLCDLDPSAKEEFWAQYWLKEALQENQNELALGHLSAYLEETCYWIALTKAQQLANSDFSWMDCFQLARTVVAQPAKLFAKYDSTRSRLKTYAQLKLGTEISEFIRVRREKTKYSEAALLRSLTKISLKQALAKVGFPKEQLSRYLLAWNCFKEIYTPTKAAGTQRLEWPEPEQLKAIAKRYNQLRLCHQLESAVTSQTLEALLKSCVKAVRDNIAPSIHSLDDSNLPLAAPDDDIEEIELRSQEWHQINSLLSDTFASLSNDYQKMLELEHGLAIKQADIGKAFNLKQYQVSRQLDKAKRVLLKALTDWSQQRLNISLSPQQIAALSPEIDGWLRWYCQSLFQDVLTATLLQDLNDEVQLLRLHYGQNLPLQAVATKLAISESLLQGKLERVNQHLRFKLETRVQANLPIALTSLNSAEKRLTDVIEVWIKNAPYATFETSGRKLNND